MLAAGLLGVSAAGILYTQHQEELLSQILFRPPVPTTKYPKLKFLGKYTEYWEKTYTYDEKNEKNILVFYLHGRNTNIEQSVEYLENLQLSLKKNHQKIKSLVLVAPEYPGYSPSSWNQCQPTETLCKTVMKTIFNYICNRYVGFDLVVIGKSIGSGIASHLICSLSFNQPPKKQEQKINKLCIPFPSICNENQNKQKMMLVLICPYISIKHLAQDYFMGVLVDKTCLSNLHQMQQLPPNIHLLLVHGSDDNLIHWKHSLTLYQSIIHKIKKKRFELIPDVGHLSLQAVDEVAQFIMAQFLDSTFDSNTDSLIIESEKKNTK